MQCVCVVIVIVVVILWCSIIVGELNVNSDCKLGADGIFGASGECSAGTFDKGKNNNDN